MTPTSADIDKACAVLRAGGIIAYATEGVWGLGCDPFNPSAVAKILKLKQRTPSKGLIIAAAYPEQVERWLANLSAAQRQEVEATWPGPYTWVIPAPDAPEYLRGAHSSLAIRVSAHPAIQALCRTFNGPIVSTSANLSGQEPFATAEELQAEWGGDIDFILPSTLGGDRKPSEIRDALTGAVLRAR